VNECESEKAMKNSKEHDSRFLHNQPSFLLGFVSFLDWGATLDRFHQFYDLSSPELSDCLALQSDWEAVGNAFRAVMQETGRENGEE